MKSADYIKEGILLVAVGTSHVGARVALDTVELAVKKRFPGKEIRWAYTSTFIRKKLAEKGEILQSPATALERMIDERFTHVVVQSLHLVAGAEFHHLVKTIGTFRVKWKGSAKIVLGKPLLTRREDISRVVQAVLARVPGRQAEDAIVLMGHGNEAGWGELALAATAMVFQQADERAFLGTMKGFPSFSDVLEQCKAAGVNRAFLVPFLLVAGNHAAEQLAGKDADSWKSQLEELNLDCVPVLKGLGENPGVVDVWLDHLAEAQVECLSH